MYIELASAKIEAPVYAFQKALLQRMHIKPMQRNTQIYTWP